MSYILKLVKIRVSNASGFYLRAIAGPVISKQFRAIPYYSAQYQEKLRKIPHSGVQFRATEFRLETPVKIKSEMVLGRI